MDLTLYLIVALGAVIAGFSQGLSGFGFGLVAMSFWAWVIDPKLAAVLSVTGGLTGQIVAFFRVRRGFSLSLLAPFVLGGLAGIPIGVGILPMLDIHWFKTILGIFLVIWSPSMLWLGHHSLIKKRYPFADAIVGLGGGIMGGIGGFTGTLPTLWCTISGYDRDRQRSIIQNFNFTMLVVIFVTYLSKGIIQSPMWQMIALVSPIVILTAFLGTRLYMKISPERFKQIILTLLTLSGITMLITSVPPLLAR